MPHQLKFEYAFWRPVTAIQDGTVQPDPTWEPLSVTPRYPEHPRGHGGYAGAAQEVLTAFLGPQAPAPTRSPAPRTPASPAPTPPSQRSPARASMPASGKASTSGPPTSPGPQVGKQVADYGLARLPRLLF